MFGLAGWKTPIALPEVERKAVPSSYSICFDSIQGNDWKEENKHRIDQSISDLLRSVNNETSHLDVLIKDLVEITTRGTSTQTSLSLDSSISTSTSSFLTSSFPNSITTSFTTANVNASTASAAAAMVTAEDTEHTTEGMDHTHQGNNNSSNTTAMHSSSYTADIPQSLEDIYHLASKNRKKNKNKKRKPLLEGSGGGNAGETMNYDEYVYESGKPSDVSTVDATVSNTAYSNCVSIVFMSVFFFLCLMNIYSCPLRKILDGYQLSKMCKK